MSANIVVFTANANASETIATIVKIGLLVRENRVAQVGRRHRACVRG
jgi:hypothetical protein